MLFSCYFYLANVDRISWVCFSRLHRKHCIYLDVSVIIEYLFALCMYIFLLLSFCADDDIDDINLTTEDPDRMSREQLDELLDLELRRERLLHEASAVKSTGPSAQWLEEYVDLCVFV